MISEKEKAKKLKEKEKAKKLREKEKEKRLREKEKAKQLKEKEKAKQLKEKEKAKKLKEKEKAKKLKEKTKNTLKSRKVSGGNNHSKVIPVQARFNDHDLINILRENFIKIAVILNSEEFSSSIDITDNLRKYISSDNFKAHLNALHIVKKSTLLASENSTQLPKIQDWNLIVIDINLLKDMLIMSFIYNKLHNNANMAEYGYTEIPTIVNTQIPTIVNTPVNITYPSYATTEKIHSLSYEAVCSCLKDDSIDIDNLKKLITPPPTDEQKTIDITVNETNKFNELCFKFIHVCIEKDKIEKQKLQQQSQPQPKGKSGWSSLLSRVSRPKIVPE
jgi:hypothetical protein